MNTLIQTALSVALLVAALILLVRRIRIDTSGECGCGTTHSCNCTTDTEKN